MHSNICEIYSPDSEWKIKYKEDLMKVSLTDKQSEDGWVEMIESFLNGNSIMLPFTDEYYNICKFLSDKQYVETKIYNKEYLKFLFTGDRTN